jgi:hypothetical protein
MTLPGPANDFASQEVIRPAAVFSEAAARQILKGLAGDDVRHGGHWWTRIGTWRRYATPWAPGTDEPGDAVHIGTISSVYDSPARYCVTVFRVSLTAYGLRQGWTTASLCDEAFGHGGFTLADCPRVAVPAPPRPFAEMELRRGPTGPPV